MKGSESMTEIKPVVLTSTSSSRAKIFRATSCSCYRQLYSFMPVLKQWGNRDHTGNFPMFFYHTGPDRQKFMAR